MIFIHWAGVSIWRIHCFALGELDLIYLFMHIFEKTYKILEFAVKNTETSFAFSLSYAYLCSEP